MGLRAAASGREARIEDGGSGSLAGTLVETAHGGGSAPPLRICFFNRSYFPEMSATGQLLTELAEGLVRDHGCEVSVIAGRPISKKGETGTRARGWRPVTAEFREGVKIFRAGGTVFGHGNIAGRISNYLTYFISAAMAGFRAPRPDVVVALTDPPIIGLVALLKARLSGGRFVFVCQDIFPEVANVLEGFRSEAVNRVLDAINRFLIRKADRVVALGDTMRERLVSLKGADERKVAVIHNWADCSAIAPGPKRNSFSLSNGLADKFVIMHSGNIGMSQNLDVLLDAAARLRAFPRMIVAMVGDGVKSERLEQRVRDENIENVRFFPYQPKENLAESFAAADVFLVSLKEGLAGFIVPSKLYGILAAGRPFVAAVEEDSEVAAIVREYDCGLLVRVGDPEDLAEKITRLYSDPELARRLGENARRAALHFDRPGQISAYCDLFRGLISAVPAARPSALKRPFDIALSGAGLVLSSPLWLLIAFLVKLEDGGPVFYSQDRVGKYGKLFKIWKFRSMIPDADEGFGAVQASENDPRVTKIGRLLRETAMDELPQLLSIFRGDMSFVGPRALLPGEKEIYGDGAVRNVSEFPGAEERLLITPGLTGLAQIYGKHDTPRARKFKYDILYRRKQSFWLDIKLIVLSFWITLRGKWETREKKI